MPKYFSFQGMIQITVFSLAAVLFLCICPVSALSSKGLTLSPLRTEIEVLPGTSYTGELVLTNSTENEMVIDLNAEEFSVINQQYDYAFTPESNVAKWIRFDSNQIALNPNQSESISFTVGAPLSAEPGGRYLGLFASTDIKDQVGVIGSKQRIASLLYVTVSGDVSRSGNLLSLISPWLIFDDSNWGVTLQNTGTTHYRSRYKLTISNIINKKIISETTGEALILPGTVRAVYDDIPSPDFPGIYKLTYTIGLGDTPAKTEVRYVIFLPPYLLALIIIAALLVIMRNRLKAKKKSN